MKNENKTDEMVQILSQLHQYVPMKRETMAMRVPCTGDMEEVCSESLHHLLVGGDQLTAERVRGAQSLRRNSTTAAGRLDGFLPVSEDWHAKVCFLQVCQSIINYRFELILFRSCGRGFIAGRIHSLNQGHLHNCNH